MGLTPFPEKLLNIMERIWTYAIYYTFCIPVQLLPNRVFNIIDIIFFLNIANHLGTFHNLLQKKIFFPKCAYNIINKLKTLMGLTLFPGKLLILLEQVLNIRHLLHFLHSNATNCAFNIIDIDFFSCWKKLPITIFHNLLQKKMFFPKCGAYNIININWKH